MGFSFPTSYLKRRKFVNILVGQKIVKKCKVWGLIEKSNEFAFIILVLPISGVKRRLGEVYETQHQSVIRHSSLGRDVPWNVSTRNPTAIS